MRRSVGRSSTGWKLRCICVFASSIMQRVRLRYSNELSFRLFVCLLLMKFPFFFLKLQNLIHPNPFVLLIPSCLFLRLWADVQDGGSAFLLITVTNNFNPFIALLINNIDARFSTMQLERRRNSAPPCLTSASTLTYPDNDNDNDDDAHAVPSNCSCSTPTTPGSCLLRYQHLLHRSLQLFSTQRIDSRRAGWLKSSTRPWMCVLNFA